MTSRDMRVLRRPTPVLRQVRAWHAAGERIAFVPTMGALHEGHRSLLRLARRRADRVVMSVFVNPAQFGSRADLENYPRTLRADLRAGREEGVDLAYTPAVETVYPGDPLTSVRVRDLESELEGESRPGHFAGVTLVVLKLLHVVEPDLLVLGQKDAQQAVILERMISDLDVPVSVIRGATVRESDGLALSSRNARLGDRDRDAATALIHALREGARAIRAGVRSAAAVRRRMRRVIEAESRVRLDYVEVVDARSLKPLRRVRGRVLLPGAIHVGPVRLIDNLQLRVEEA